MKIILRFPRIKLKASQFHNPSHIEINQTSVIADNSQQHKYKKKKLKKCKQNANYHNHYRTVSVLFKGENIRLITKDNCNQFITNYPFLFWMKKDNFCWKKINSSSEFEKTPKPWPFYSHDSIKANLDPIISTLD